MQSFLRALPLPIVLLHVVMFFFAKETPAQSPYYKKEILIPASLVTGSSEIKTLDGGIMRLLETQDSVSPFRHLTMIKMNSTGAVLWYRYLSSTYSYGAANIVQAPDSGYFVCCMGGVSTYTMLKTDKDGNEQFSSKIDLPSAYSIYSLAHVKAKNDGGFYIAASLLDAASSVELWHLLEIDTYGSIASSNCYNMFSGKSRVHDVDTCANGDVILLGSVWAPSAMHAPVLTRIDTSGAVVWSKVFPSVLNMVPVDLVRSDGDFIYVLGQTSFTSGAQTALMKLDGSGNELWTLNYSAPSATLRPVTMTHTAAGNILITGEAIFIKTDSAGVPLCARQYPGLTLSSVLEITPQLYRLSGLTSNTPTGVIITTDSCGYTCEDAALAVIKTAYTVSDSIITGFMPMPLSRIDYSFPEDTMIILFDETCSLTGMTSVAQDGFVELLPNPASSLLTIRSSERMTAVQLLDISGRTILSRKIDDQEAQLDVSVLSTGCYVVLVNYENHVESKRLIIE